MRYPERPKAAIPDAVVVRPSKCPACQSQDISTTSKVVNDAAYWRCGKCGEVWNVGRRRAPVPRDDYRRWGR